MPRHLIRAFRLGFAGVVVIATTAFAEAPAAAPADVGTIADIVRVSYEVISGPAGVPREWQRDATQYMPGARYAAVREEKGKVLTTIMTPEEYRQRSDARFVAEGLFETQVGSRTERWGNVAQVRSVAVSRTTKDGPIDARFVNYFQLYFDGNRWWIASVVWDQERPGNPIQESWIGRDEVETSEK